MPMSQFGAPTVASAPRGPASNTSAAVTRGVTVPWSVTRQPPAVAWAISIGLAAGSHDVPEPSAPIGEVGSSALVGRGASSSGSVPAWTSPCVEWLCPVVSGVG